jgi:hypothetical protein
MSNWTSLAAADHREALQQAAEAHRQVANRRRHDRHAGHAGHDQAEGHPEPVRHRSYRRWAHILAFRW